MSLPLLVGIFFYPVFLLLVRTWSVCRGLGHCAGIGDLFPGRMFPSILLTHGAYFNYLKCSCVMRAPCCGLLLINLVLYFFRMQVMQSSLMLVDETSKRL
jgi:hypothetical protein